MHDHSDSKQTMRAADYEMLLKRHNLRVTAKRLAVLEVLTAASGPQTTEEILAAAEQQMDKVTVYRMLDDFVRLGIVRQIDFRDGVYRYELEHDHHHHLKCTQCERVIPIYDQCLQLDEAKIKQKHGFVVTDHALEFFGLCVECAEMV